MTGPAAHREHMLVIVLSKTGFLKAVPRDGIPHFLCAVLWLSSSSNLAEPGSFFQVDLDTFEDVASDFHATEVGSDLSFRSHIFLSRQAERNVQSRPQVKGPGGIGAPVGDASDVVQGVKVEDGDDVEWRKGGRSSLH